MDVTWKNNKRAAGAIAAVLLMAVSALGFTVGLSFKLPLGGMDFGWIVGGLVWLALTVVQMLGNDEENRDDWILFSGWIFTYILGVGATSWAMYSWIVLPASADALRWIISIGLGGAIEILPERLIYLYIKSLKKPSTQTRVPQQIPSQYKNHVPPPSAQRSTFQPQHKPVFGNQQQKQNRVEPKYHPDPTYRNIYRDEDEQ